ncbi:hypothetical protein SPRG_04735 [Saprolegnia parasitica CBS 223.65]|uniref:Uncharacterized protein n=1 Tax=Saprolegnia parasitica (strain CBS 223.65) TaxID=695850 RepID=A0A067CJC6_SAPPC|nr:hypothetical protein SPRG_04735 [Saprolegnia parasitica CBS 223.65]KDO30834.1 hypothetical protein SPRG_04735 [Saprolegnia parasitica CBS 223.65]|eukprot:XP_012198531.1 hypothetical protein SPRG_04735 [Saprolegnia parasitica CBS 223.65]
MAISFLRHSAVVASVNAIGAGAPVRRPVCSMSSLQSQIDAIKSAAMLVRARLWSRR